jgi:hypothetical protein
MASKKKEEEKQVTHLADIYLRGGQHISLRVHKLETGITDEGKLASYNLELHPDENVSYMYMDPSEVASIITRVEPEAAPVAKLVKE